MPAQELMKKSMAELKRQYVKQSYVARQRFAALAKEYSGSEIVQRRQGDFKPLRKLGRNITKKELAMEVSDLTRFLSSSSSRVNEYGEVRKNIVQSFQEHQYDVTEENLDALTTFLEDARQRHLSAIYSSDQIVEVFKRAEKRGLTREQVLGNIEYWVKHAPKKPRLYASRHSSVKDFYGND